MVSIQVDNTIFDTIKDMLKNSVMYGSEPTFEQITEYINVVLARSHGIKRDKRVE